MYIRPESAKFADDYNKPITGNKGGLTPKPNNLIKVLESVSQLRSVKLSIWFDGFLYHPLVETLDASGNAISGRLLRTNARLISAMRYSESWILDMIPITDENVQ